MTYRGCLPTTLAAAALAAGDAEALLRTFAPDGYYREPAGAHCTHRGRAELRSFFRLCFSAGGGIVLRRIVLRRIVLLSIVATSSVVGWHLFRPSVFAEWIVVAGFLAFDDPDRNVLYLFKLHPLPNGEIRQPNKMNLQIALPDDKIDIPVE